MVPNVPRVPSVPRVRGVPRGLQSHNWLKYLEAL